MDCAPATEPACKPERNPRPTSLLAPCVLLRQETRHRPPAAEPIRLKLPGENTMQIDRVAGGEWWRIFPFTGDPGAYGAGPAEHYPKYPPPCATRHPCEPAGGT